MNMIRQILPEDIDPSRAATLIEAGLAIAGVARVGKKIWIVCDSEYREEFSAFVRNIDTVPAIILSSVDPNELARLGQEGDLLLLLIPISTSLTILAQSIGIRIINFDDGCDQISYSAFDLKLNVDFVKQDLELLTSILKIVFKGRQTQKFFRNWEELLAAVRGLHPLVFTNGVFDIIHRGHIHSLQAARKEGAYLVVGVNSDKSVKRLGKGNDRPVQSEEERAAIIEAISCVDFVTIFDEDNPSRLIKSIVPDVLVKGGDYNINNISGADFIRERGGKVITIPFQYDSSTTKIISRIRQHGN